MRARRRRQAVAVAFVWSGAAAVMAAETPENGVWIPPAPISVRDNDAGDDDEDEGLDPPETDDDGIDTPYTDYDGVDTPTDGDGIDTPTPTDDDGIDTPYTDYDGIDTPPTDDDGVDTPTPTDDDGIDTPYTDYDGVDTPTDGDGIDTPTPTDDDGIDTPYTDYDGIDTPPTDDDGIDTPTPTDDDGIDTPYTDYDGTDSDGEDTPTPTAEVSTLQGDSKEIFDVGGSYRVLTGYGNPTDIVLNNHLATGVEGITFALKSCDDSRGDYYSSAIVENGILVLQSNTLGHVHGPNTQVETVCTVTGSLGDLSEDREFRLYTVSDRTPPPMIPGSLTLVESRPTEVDVRITVPEGSLRYLWLGWRKAGDQPSFGVVSGVSDRMVVTIPGLEADTEYDVRAYWMTAQGFDLYRGTNSGSAGDLIAGGSPDSKWIRNLSGGGLGKSAATTLSTAPEPTPVPTPVPTPEATPVPTPRPTPENEDEDTDNDGTDSDGIDTPETDGDGFDTEANTDHDGIDTPETDGDGFDTEANTDSDGFDTPTPTDSDGIDTPTPTDSDGIDTPTPTDSDGIDTPTPTDSDGIDTPTPTDSDGIDTPAPTDNSDDSDDDSD